MHIVAYHNFKKSFLFLDMRTIFCYLKNEKKTKNNVGKIKTQFSINTLREYFITLLSAYFFNTLRTFIT